MGETISMVLAAVFWLIKGPTVEQEEPAAVFYSTLCRHDLTFRERVKRYSLKSTLMMLSRDVWDIIICSNTSQRLILCLVSSD